MKTWELPLYEEFCKKCKSFMHCPFLHISGETCMEMPLFEKLDDGKQECFFCKRRFFPDDPEYNVEKHICDNCADELEKDNPYNTYAYNGSNHDGDDE